MKVTLSIPSKTYDRYCTTALHRGVSVPEVLRQALKKDLPEKPER